MYEVSEINNLVHNCPIKPKKIFACPRCFNTGGEKTRHHIIPQEYLCASEELRNVCTQQDIVNICQFCHEEYEYEAKKFRQTLGKIFQVPYDSNAKQKIKDKHINAIVKKIKPTVLANLWRMHFNQVDLKDILQKYLLEHNTVKSSINFESCVFVPMDVNKITQYSVI